jgi:hypothetical protein
VDILKMKTTFVNDTSSVITLKEANSGIHRFMVKLEKQGHPRSSFEMDLDTNATYREYHLFNVVSASSADIVVSSDHLIDNKVITIMEVTPGVLSWEGTLRKDPTKKQPEEEGSPGHEGQAAASGTTVSLGRWLSSNGLSKWIMSLSRKLLDQ